ncbi:anaphase-promoting complex subunit 5-domain-containing protein [Chytriomyces cf. hyalinus JEL632]|nr:anaphase-promoting complex subunit 5-domain-containing protein [Chytriomyces cf. hyalinus JEL632]
MLTPASFLVLVVLVEYCIEHGNGGWSAEDAEANAQRFLLRRLCTQKPPNLSESSVSIMDELSQINVMDDISLKTVVLFQLRKISLISHLDAIFDIAEAIVTGEPSDNTPGLDLENILTLKRRSEFGIFVRKLLLEYRCFSFSDLASFFEKVTEMRDALVDLDETPNGIQVNDAATIETEAGISSEDADTFLNFYALYAESTGVALPEELEVKLQAIHAALPDQSRVYYVQYLTATRRGDFDLALQKLHQFYDYGATQSSSSQRHFALLDLAVLHATFGQIDEACKVLNEAISVARSVKDSECLVFCLSWACKLQDNGGKIDGIVNHQSALVDSLVNSSKNLGMPHLQQLGHLYDAENSLNSGQIKPYVFESLKRARSIQPSSRLDPIPPPAQDQSLLISIAEAKTWAQYGNSYISRMHLDLVDSENAPLSELYNARAEDAVTALSIKADKAFLNGNPNDAAAYLQEAKDLAPPSNIHSAKPWAFVEAKIQFQIALNSFAQFSSLSLLQEAMSEAASSNADWKFQAELLRCQMLVRFGCANEAFESVAQLIQDSAALGCNERNVQALLFLANLHLSQHSPHAALPILLSAITLSSDMSYSQAEHGRTALVHLSRYFLAVGMPEKARSILDSVLGPVLVHSNAFERGLVQSTLAECMIQQVSSKETSNNTDSRNLLSEALNLFNAAFKSFESVSDLESLRSVAFQKAVALKNLGNDFSVECKEAVRLFHHLDSLTCLKQ